MLGTREIRRRIKSVKNTAQVTRAMQLVAASKMRKAQDKVIAGRPYAKLLGRMLERLTEKGTDFSYHPLLDQRNFHKELVLMLTTDKGLCGALNTNLFRETMALNREVTQFISVGKKGSQFLGRTKRRLVAEFSLPDTPSFLQTKTISKFMIEKFVSAEVSQVSILFPKFLNTLTQRPRKLVLLPLSNCYNKEKVAVEPQEHSSVNDGSLFLFEPSPDKVLDAILPYYVHFEVYQMILDARASEHSARVVAMKSATDNAHHLVKDLTLEYNKARQASITTELLEISTAQLATE
ncbi:ATP synthase gamma chain [Candidatus Xiphinematobacter sp. Idaho Grape]|uniref:ATP synthase F1 subunit gamma n=1 Tax=Candidatus Xiphinematobacter sp. Idaho Grape TaxID=1704307 RepID=UPI000706E667|nr:ATP synthase F1 subunit gamma [Candidatus Xiphinematobacter sp. Idaho Grape]ALJ56486.1 ATP synthase gamma chain [Candidatus Xiphinematobacter sp. Idaho Grape]